MSDLWTAVAPSDTDADAGVRDRAPTIGDEGLAASKAIQRRTGTTFHLATRLFPREIRHATYVLYGFVRIADEVVDGPGERDPEAQRAAIDRLRAVALEDEPTDDPVLSAFQTVRDAYGIQREDVAACHEIAAADDTIDARCYDVSETVTRELVERDGVGEDPGTVDAQLDAVARVLLTIRDLERVADHAVNIAARTLYMVEQDPELIY